jgi:non-ribosomal peptide synthetase component E (peptide arylation enzyme)
MAANGGPANFGVGTWIERRARIAPHDVALIADAQPLTYAELAARIRRLANGLRGLGVSRGDRVARGWDRISRRSPNRSSRRGSWGQRSRR